MPLMERLLPFFEPVRGCFNILNRDFKKLVMPLHAPSLAQHQMQCRSPLNQGTGAMVKPGGLFA